MSDTLENVVDFLPESVKELVDVIGFPATEKLVRRFGGASFKFSSASKKYFNKVAECLGDEMAHLVVNYFSGEEFHVPRCDRALRVLRNRRFYEAFCALKAEGMSGRMAMVELCPKFQISWRTAWEIVARNQRAPRVALNTQGSLF